MNLGQSAYPRPKGTGDHNMPIKRGPAKSADQTPCKTRVVRSRLNCQKFNPDRDMRSPIAMLTKRDVTICRWHSCGQTLHSGERQACMVRYREMISGVGMSERPNPR